MDTLRIESADDPFTYPETAMAASTLLERAESMGFLDEMEPISHLDLPVIKEILTRLGREGLMQGAIAHGGGALPHEPNGILRLLEQANVALEDSAVPAREWSAMRATLGDDLLARLCRISIISLRRYASGARHTPDAVAQRLHTLALIVADLRGAYNGYGVRRWFQRVRPQLNGCSPESVLSLEWSPDSPEVAQLRELAGALRGSPAT